MSCQCFDMPPENESISLGEKPKSFSLRFLYSTIGTGSGLRSEKCALTR